MPRMSSLSVSFVRLSILNRASLTCIEIISKSFPDILASACVAFLKWFFCLSYANRAPLPTDAIFFILSLSFFSSSISLFLCFWDIVIFGRILCLFIRSDLFITTISFSIGDSSRPEKGAFSLLDPKKRRIWANSDSFFALFVPSTSILFFDFLCPAVSIKVT